MNTQKGFLSTVVVLVVLSVLVAGVGVLVVWNDQKYKPNGGLSPSPYGEVEVPVVDFTEEVSVSTKTARKTFEFSRSESKLTSPNLPKGEFYDLPDNLEKVSKGRHEASVVIEESVDQEMDNQNTTPPLIEPKPLLSNPSGELVVSRVQSYYLPPEYINPKTGCQVHFTMAYVYLYEPGGHVPENLERLKSVIPVHEEALNIAGRGRVTFEIEPEITKIPLSDDNRDDLMYVYEDSTLSLNASGLMESFYRTKPDEYDFFSVFHNFTGDTGGRSHRILKNFITGIGYQLLDTTKNDEKNFNRLIGYNNMGNLNTIYSGTQTGTWGSEDSGLVRFLIHETAHQWGAYVGMGKDIGGSDFPVIADNLGHWVQELSLKSDPLGGGNWKDDGSGRLAAWSQDSVDFNYSDVAMTGGGISTMSDLSLYLIGAMTKDEVEPIPFVSRGAALNEVRYITIDEIIGRYGERKCFVDPASQDGSWIFGRSAKRVMWI